jgi:hypothetical protein
MSVSTVAGVNTAVLGGYIVATDWVPIRRWNDNIRVDAIQGRVVSSLVHGTLCGLFSVANFLRWHWVILAGAVWFAVLLTLELRNWWLPYLFGVEGEITAEVYRRSYATNLRFLPQRGEHAVVPDAQHVVMQLLTASTTALSFASFVAT